MIILDSLGYQMHQTLMHWITVKFLYRYSYQWQKNSSIRLLVNNFVLSKINQLFSVVKFMKSLLPKTKAIEWPYLAAFCVIQNEDLNSFAHIFRTGTRGKKLRVSNNRNSGETKRRRLTYRTYTWNLLFASLFRSQISFRSWAFLAWAKNKTMAGPFIVKPLKNSLNMKIAFY